MAQEKVIVTRPMPQAEATAKRVASLGFDPVIAPVIRYEPRDAVIPADCDGLVFTSAAGVRYGAPQVKWRDMPVWCVGPVTADAARAAGFRDVTTGPGDAAGLVRILPARRLLHLAGADHRDLPGTEAVVVYSAKVVPAVPEVAADGSAAAVLFYSPRAARLFLDLAPRRPPLALCLSGAVAAVAAASMAVKVASEPTEDALLALLPRRSAC